MTTLFGSAWIKHSHSSPACFDGPAPQPSPSPCFDGPAPQPSSSACFNGPASPYSAIRSHHQACDASSKELGYLVEGVVQCGHRYFVSDIAVILKLQALLHMQDTPAAVNALQIFNNISPWWEPDQSLEQLRKMMLGKEETFKEHLR
ncbi:hypothetical protein OROMI_018516 [Orobanche minor]